jgi:exodeoxyribonuclease V
MSWSPQQEAAIRDVRAWIKNPNGKKIFRIFGFAGTGKTTIAKELAGLVNGKVLFATFTGKAAMVLRQKGCEGASTIHSLIYTVEVDPATGITSFKLNELGDLSEAELLIVDEVSMVGEELGNDLLSFGKPILVLGDPAQLPPIRGEGFFISAEPDVMLTEVHRQAQDNPIIRMSMNIREGKRLVAGTYDTSQVLDRRMIDREHLGQMVLEADQMLCGLNKTRTTYNGRIRALKGLVGSGEDFHPTVGDRLICLKNKSQKGLFNGGIWEAKTVKQRYEKLRLVVESLDEERDALEVNVFENFFNGTEKELDWKELRGTEQFTFGWAITCHKSQGSQWDNVLVFDESGAFRDDREKWLYTAITRAAEKLTVIL